ncbi:MAG TPA: hypothetical protein VH393_08380 [Ktedonobacterales bacterium]|jgi:hypothetical protein
MMNTTRDLFVRAAQRQTLTPAERALLRLAEGLAATALVAALPIVAQALSDGTLDWGNVARTALAAAAVAVLLALVKYARAFGDPPLEGAGSVASGVASEPGQSDLAGDAAN